MSHTAWMLQAESDLEAAKLLTANNHHAQAVWFAGQAVEKAHKAILVALGLRYEEKHFKQLNHSTSEVAKLLPAALHDPVDAQIAVIVSTLEMRAMGSRYPSPKAGASVWTAPVTAIGPSAQDVADAERLLTWCRERVARAINATAAMKP